MNIRGLVCAYTLLFSAATLAHSVSTSYIQVVQSNAPGDFAVQVDLSLRDLDAVVNLDPNQDGAVTWQEVTAARNDIDQYVVQGLNLSGDSHHCELRPQDLLVDEHADGPYAVIKLTAGCAATTHLTVHSDLLYEVDLSQRSILSFVRSTHSYTSILSSDSREWTAPASAAESTHTKRRQQAADLLRFVKQGVWHIWTGYDHLAFLLLLLLPAVIQRDRESSIHLIKRLFTVVTAFTIAHSVTLALAALGYIKLPTRLTESGIAASIAISGAINLHPRARNLGVFAAFGFGLVHGFGFASALADLNLDAGNRLVTLFGFNLGVEIGQLAVVAASLPILWWMRGARWYPRLLMPAASLALSALGVLWFWQRAFG